MIYSIGFKQKTGQMYEYNGQKYMYVDEESGVFLKELCGEYPSRWDCRSVSYMRPIFDYALRNLLENKKEYEYFSNGKFSSPEEIQIILNELIKRCEAFPDAVMEVDW